MTAESEARRIVEARSDHRCELCHAHATDWCHRVSRARLGPWRASNGIMGCRHHHHVLTNEPLIAEALGWSLLPGAEPTLWPAYINGPLGLGWHLMSDDGGLERVEGPLVRV